MWAGVGGWVWGDPPYSTSNANCTYLFIYIATSPNQKIIGIHVHIIRHLKLFMCVYKYIHIYIERYHLFNSICPGVSSNIGICILIEEFTVRVWKHFDINVLVPMFLSENE